MLTLTKTQFEKCCRESVCIWEEDDAAPDAEQIHTASRRIWPHQRWDDPIFSDDMGETTLLVYSRGRTLIILSCSYPGNSSIRVANAPELVKSQGVRFGVGVRHDEKGVGMVWGPAVTIAECEEHTGGPRFVICELPSGRIVRKWKTSLRKWVPYVDS